jgi:hypothetical protein
MSVEAHAPDTRAPDQNQWTCYIEAAQYLCQCDQRTAERLVFVRWLYRTGRLHEEEPAGERER